MSAVANWWTCAMQFETWLCQTVNSPQCQLFLHVSPSKKFHLSVFLSLWMNFPCTNIKWNIKSNLHCHPRCVYVYLCGPQRRQQNANTNRKQEKSNLHCHPGYEQPACAANTAGNQEQICQHRILEHFKKEIFSTEYWNIKKLVKKRFDAAQNTGTF